MKKARLTKRPDCQLCSTKPPKKAKYDAKTIHGPWAYMCDDCMKIHGIQLGMGLGQELQIEGEDEDNGKVPKL